jgi:hypothetical protein
MGSLGLSMSFLFFKFDLSRRAFEPPQEILIYYDLWTEAIVMATSVNPF